MVKYGDTNKQIALLEFGWTSDRDRDSPYNWHAVSEQTRRTIWCGPTNTPRRIGPLIGLMSLIYICDPDWTQNNEQYWAISDPLAGVQTARSVHRPQNYAQVVVR